MTQKSSLALKRRTIYAHVNDPSLQATGGRITLFPEPKKDCEDELTRIKCRACNREMRVRKKDTKNCDCYWCGHECMGKDPWEFPTLPEGTQKKDGKDEEKTCPKCKGPARGRGFVHTEDCEEVVKKSEKRACPECKGPAKGRGFNHVGECSLKTQPYVPVKERNGEAEENSTEG